jgi:hypothetical protein
MPLNKQTHFVREKFTQILFGNKTIEFMYNQVMKYVFLLTVILFSGCAMQTVESQTKKDEKPIVQTKAKQPVLVELFTSEGCSSCPPADKTLAMLRSEQAYANAEIITLAFHVDYWDRLGWKDEFSSKLFTQRQESYTNALQTDGSYTPQMVVDGRNEFVGSNLAKISLAMNAAPKNEKGKIELESTKETSLKLKISELPTHKESTVFVAIAEDNLFTDVKRGENGGRKLEHDSVVRELKSIGSITSEQNSFEIETQPQFDAKWKRKDLRIVVFVQENTSRKVIAVGQTQVVR